MHDVSLCGKDGLMGISHFDCQSYALTAVIIGHSTEPTGSTGAIRNTVDEDMACASSAQLARRPLARANASVMPAILLRYCFEADLHCCSALPNQCSSQVWTSIPHSRHRLHRVGLHD